MTDIFQDIHYMYDLTGLLFFPIFTIQYFTFWSDVYIKMQKSRSPTTQTEIWIVSA